MCSFAADYDRSKGASPDRLDALAWALTELMVEGVPGWGILEHYRLNAARAKEPANVAPAAATVKLAAPPGFATSTLITMSGRSIALGDDRVVEVSEDDAKPMVNAGWTRVEPPPQEAAA